MNGETINYGSVINSVRTSPLPYRGGVGGGVSILLAVKELLTPPLPLPYKGGELAAHYSG